MTLQFPDPASQTFYAYEGRNYIWDGIGWHLDSNNILNRLQPAAQAELTYVLVTPVDEVVFSDPDLTGQTYTLETTLPGEGVEVHLDGIKVIEDIDYFVDRANNRVTFPADLPASTAIQVSILTPRSEIAPGQVEVHKLLNLDIDWSDGGQPPGQIDGVNTQFQPYYADPVTSDPVAILGTASSLSFFYGGVRQIPGEDYTVSGAVVTFAQPPQPGVGFWGIYYSSVPPGNGQTLLASGTSAQRDAIASPLPGIRINTETGTLEFYNGSTWLTVTTV